MTEQIRIRLLSTLADIAPIEELQARIWGYDGRHGRPFPYAVRCIYEFAESGGVVAGAFDAKERMIAFAFGWLGQEETGRLYLHSQLVGVLPEYQNRAVGFKLKLFQREYARKRDIPVIKWTFDPLRVRNARLNLHKLGGIVRRFIPDYYGDLGGTESGGRPTDRFWVEWYVCSSHVDEALRRPRGDEALRDFPVVNTITSDKGFGELRSGLDAEYLLVRVPMDMQQLVDDLSRNQSVIDSWQNGLRTVFREYLDSHVVIDCIRGRNEFFYLLARHDVGAVPDLIGLS